MRGTSTRIGIDVGGTFTDSVVARGDQLTTAKALTTHGAYEAGVLASLANAAAGVGLGLDELLASTERIVHGTTVATNAVLDGSLPPVALVVTKGFRDLLGMRRGSRDVPLWLHRDPPAPMVPRSRVFELDARMDRQGRTVRPPAEADLVALVEQVGATGCAAVAVSLMFSFLDGAHERLLADRLRRDLPGVDVYASIDVLPTVGYFERTSTVVINAAVSPIMSSYLDSLAATLRAHRFGGSLLVLQSNGGASSPHHAARNGVRSVLSGPSVGPVAAAALAGPTAGTSLISVDMGGTSFDVSLVLGGRPTVTTEGGLGGRRIAVPMVEIHAIGAGGGSIVSLDGRGFLRVGPESAGSEPGPACYGRGGTQPTVSDADLILGHLDPASFTVSGRPLDEGAARRAFEREVAPSLGISAEEAAAGAHRLVNAAMADAIREVSLRRGHDPRALPLVVGGGAGPLHVGEIALELGTPLVVVPRVGSTYCAFGALVSDLCYELTASMAVPLDDATGEELAEGFATLAERAGEILQGEGVAEGQRALEDLVDLRYRGQLDTVAVVVPARPPGQPVDVGALAADFHEAHRQRNGHSDPSLPVEVVAVRTVARGLLPKPSLAPPAGSTGEPRPIGGRLVHVAGQPEKVPVYDDLVGGIPVEGPALVEWPHTTILVPPGLSASADSGGHIYLHPAGTTLAGVLEEVSVA